MEDFDNEFEETSDVIDIESADHELENIESELDELLPTDEDDFDDNFEKRVEELDISQELASIVDQDIQPLVLPKSHGHWTGAPGDSEFVLDDDFTPSGRGVNLENLTMREIKQHYGFDGVEYKNKEPDFLKFADEKIGAITLDEFSSERTGKDGTYALATAKAAEQLGITPAEIETMMEERGLTWHECGDRKTVLPIPTEVNATFKHSGGISIEKNVNTFGEYLNDTYGKLTLDRASPFSGEQEVDLDIEAAQKQIRQGVRDYKKSK